MDEFKLRRGFMAMGVRESAEGELQAELITLDYVPLIS
jgi:hypothetical protein